MTILYTHNQVILLSGFQTLKFKIKLLANRDSHSKVPFF